jgi:hypothetical protein
MKMVATNQKIVKVSLLTPYLIEKLEDRGDPKWVQKQKDTYGYDPNNLRGVRTLSTLDHQVILETKDHHTACNAFSNDIVVIGSTRGSEERVQSAKEYGTVVGRYSIFYGGPSGYTNNSVSQTGFALDIPKNVDAVKALLTHDGFLDAIVAREEGQIRSALDDLNRGLPKPVLATEYLTIALGLPKLGDTI